MPASGDDLRSAFSVLVEGVCPKLAVSSAGSTAFLVFGTYGLDAVPFEHERAASAEVAAAQSLVELGVAGPVRDPKLLAGLPTTATGYVPADLELGGLSRERLWLARVETKRGGDAQGTLYEHRRTYYAWSPAGWRHEERAEDLATPGPPTPPLPMAALCDELGPELRFATHATARLPTGQALVAGRCEDELHRARGGVRVVSVEPGEAAWRTMQAPSGAIFDSIVNLGLALDAASSGPQVRPNGRPSVRRAYLHAYPPYATGDSEAYLVRIDGPELTALATPFPGPVVSIAAAADGALWVVAGWRELWRLADGRWQRVTLPAPRFVAPLPPEVRLLEVQVAGHDVFVHAAYPISLPGGERAGARGHVLYTTRPVDRPLYCDRRRPAAEALSDAGPTLQGAAAAP